MKFVDMFCGIGGFRLGLEKASNKIRILRQQDLHGHCPSLDECRQSNGKTPSGNRGEESLSCCWANDNDKYACQIYREHWDDGTLQEGDIRAVDASAIPGHDLLCAGFPCQSFSIAGKRRGFEDTRGTLFFEICRVLRAKRPDYLLLENVRGLLSHDLGQTFEVILSSLSELGYDCQWQVFNSKDYGVPQNRERVFIVGHTRGKPRPKVFPIGEADEAYFESDKGGSQVSPAGQDTQPRDGQTEPASGDTRVNPTPNEDIATCLDANYGKGRVDHRQRTMIYDIYDQQLRANQDLAGALKGEGIADTSLGTALIFKYGVMGDKNKKWLVDGKENSRNFPQGQRVYSVDGISATLDGEAGGWGGKTGLYELPDMRIRRLTPIECERLQGFPDGWTKRGLAKEGEQTGISDTQRYKCLGNAVTTSVLAAIGERLLGQISGHR